MQQSQNKMMSIRQALISPVMAISSLSLLVSVLLSTYIDISRQKEELSDKLQTFTEIISFNAMTSIVFDDAETENMRLSSFRAAQFIDNIHVYKIQENSNKLTFFTSYNRMGVPPIPAQYDLVKSLDEPRFDQYHLDLGKQIILEGNIIGYIYIRANLSRLKSDTRNKAIVNGFIGVAILILAFMLAFQMQKRITSPIEKFLNVVRQVTRNKDYSLRTKGLNISELDILAKAFDKMLERVQQHINKQQIAEQEVRALNQQLEEKVNQRTTALKNSNQELLSTLEKMHQYQNHLVETEKMASLGQMVAGIAHEVNTPIGLGVTASTLLMDRLSAIQQDFKDKQLKSSQLERFLDDGAENLGIIYRNLERAAKLISSFKQVAVDQTNEEQRKFEVKKLIDEVLLSLQPNFKNKTHSVELDCDPSLIICSKPGPINQILINLIMNSLIHGFENLERGQIAIDVKVIANDCQIIYKDNGLGVKDEIKNRIFDPFVTTKRGTGGSGLGMHLVYNLVTQALRGSITLESELGKGVEFHIIFPLETCKDSTNGLY